MKDKEEKKEKSKEEDGLGTMSQGLGGRWAKFHPNVGNIPVSNKSKIKIRLLCNLENPG